MGRQRLFGLGELFLEVGGGGVAAELEREAGDDEEGLEEEYKGPEMIGEDRAEDEAVEEVNGEQKEGD